MNDLKLEIEGKSVAYELYGSEGPPLLLLHGFPQDRSAWRSVSPRLSDRFRIVVPDLPGYGNSSRIGPGPEGFNKSVVAEHLVEFMHALGHSRFAVVGHDRGGLVAFRMAMNHLDSVTHVGVLDILPTVDNWNSLRGEAGVFAFHLYLLAQAPDLPERMISAAPDLFFDHFLQTWQKVEGAIPEEVRVHYLKVARRAEAIAAICDDYRASAFIDAVEDRKDQEQGRALDIPVLAAWQDPAGIELPFDPAAIWSRWVRRLTTAVMPCGHFLPEECPSEVARAISDLITS